MDNISAKTWQWIYIAATLLFYGLWYYQWHVALTEGYYYYKTSILIPAIAVVLTYFSIFQQDAQEMRNRRKQKLVLSDPTLNKQLRKRLIFLVVISLSIGLLNLFFISH